MPKNEAVHMTTLKSIEATLVSIQKQLDSFVKEIDKLSFLETKNTEIDLITEEQMKQLVATTKKTKYKVYHKPTKLWVYFREFKNKTGAVDRTTICLCLQNDATVSTSKKDLRHMIEVGEFNSDQHYGQNNFLEFQIKKSNNV